MNWSLIVFVTSFLAVVYFVRGAIHVFRSPAYKSQAQQLREQRRIRKAAGRCPACGGDHKRAAEHDPKGRS